MSRHYLAQFLTVVGTCLAIFIVVGYGFDRHVHRQVVESVRAEQALVADRVVSNVESYVARVSRTVDSVLTIAGRWDGDVLEVLGRHVRPLAAIYPEIGTVVYVTPDGGICLAGEGRRFVPTGITLDDVYEGSRLAGHLRVTDTEEATLVTTADFIRFEPAVDRVVETPGLLIVKRVKLPDGRIGVILIPYQLDFIVKHFLRGGAGVERYGIFLISRKGIAVYSSTPDFLYQPFPRPGPAGGGPAVPAGAPTYREFRLGGPAGEGPRQMGYFVPLRLGDARWTLGVATPVSEIHRVERTVVLPVLLGSTAMMLLVTGVAFWFTWRISRFAHENTIFRAAVENSATSIAIVDQDLVYRFVNRAFHRITGLKPEEVVGRSVLSTRDLFEDPGLPERIEATVSQGRVWQGQCRKRRKGTGETVEVIQNVSPIFMGGRMIGSVSVQEDITEKAAADRALAEYAERLRQKTEELEQARRALEGDIEARIRAERENEALERRLRRSQTLEAVGRLAGGVAHDFNNLLGSILGCVYAVQLEVPPDSPVMDDIQRIRQLCKRGGDLTRRLLAVSRRSTGEAVPVALNDVMETVHLLLRRTLPRDIELVFSVEPRLPSIRGEPSALVSAFLNLGMNARDAMPNGGTLVVHARRETGETGREDVVVEVADTGVGIPEDLHDRVFEPFFTTKPPGQGTGLGLANVYTAVRECGGEVTLRSEKGRGTVFRLQFPAVETGAPSPAGDRPAAGHPLTAGTILVVEDEAEITRMIASVLSRHGYHVRTAVNGVDALELVRDHRDRIAGVALDLMLPGLSGEHLYRILRSLAPEIPVLFITGREDLACDVEPDTPRLPKPFTEEDMLRALETLFGAGNGPARLTG